ncbi:hypothetical protein ADIS_0467 [Lunatimonas lonarensis]|uniref:Uncharacterized protein n=1 Tax=Lunatimonas lonarensis TaxID=1232681 RepID=R7ZY26_9BACT|nr:hypothetical protein ADIS_0467 [Lunatimonas lonarensis]
MSRIQPLASWIPQLDQDGSGLGLIGFGFPADLSRVSKMVSILPLSQQGHLYRSLPYFSSIRQIKKTSVLRKHHPAGKKLYYFLPKNAYLCTTL